MRGSYIAAAVLAAAGHETPPPNNVMMWNSFKTKYGKVYNGINEDSVRFGNFQSNVEIMWATNARNLTFALGANESANLTQGVVTLVSGIVYTVAPFFTLSLFCCSLCT